MAGRVWEQRKGRQAWQEVEDEDPVGCTWSGSKLEGALRFTCAKRERGSTFQ